MYIKIDHLGEDYAGIYYDKRSIGRSKIDIDNSRDYYEINLSELAIIKKCLEIINNIVEK